MLFFAIFLSLQRLTYSNFMKKLIYILLFLVFVLPLQLLAQQKQFADAIHHVEKSDLEFKFLENKNQWESNVRYRAAIPNGMLFLKENGLHYAFIDSEPFSHHGQGKAHTHTHETIKGHGIAVQFLGANANPTMQAEGEGSERYNFFLGNDQSKWASDIKSYTKLAYKTLYEGIDMRFYTHEDALKYEFIVAPKTNPDKIRLQYDGAKAIEIENGNLKITTSVLDLIEEHPYCYQEIEGKKVEVPANFVLSGNVLSYHFPQGYDNNFPLVIDPTILFSTYSGSLSDNWGFTATFDNQGNTYAGGIVLGQQLPTTVGAFDVTYNGVWDIAILKYNAAGTGLLYGTYLGGSSSEIPASLIVNNAGNLVILGATGSADFPTSAGAFDRSFNNGSNVSPAGVEFSNGSDIFVSILSNNGSNLLASTFIGGSGNDGIINIPSLFINPITNIVPNYGDEFRAEVVVDAADNVYVASSTSSNNFPVFNPSFPYSGGHDGVAFRLNSSLSALNWSTYMGGNAQDAASGIKVNNTGEIYVVGATTSNNFAMPAGGMQSSFSGGTDGFVLRYSPTGSLLGGTYIGTSNYDQAYLIDLDGSQNVYVLGNTRGGHPISPNTFNNTNGGHFIYKLNPTLNTRLISTQFGANNGRVPSFTPTAFMVNDCGNIYFAGWGGLTNGNATGIDMFTTGLPTTSDAFRTGTSGDDFYLAILGKDARSLLYGTFFGGNGNTPGDADHVDGGTSRFSKSGLVYHSICACRTNNVPTTPGVWQPRNGAAPVNACNNATFKMDLDPFTVDFTPIDVATNQPVALNACVPITVRMRNTTRNATIYDWNLGTFGTSAAFEPTITLTTAGTYTFTLRASNPDFCLGPITVTKTIQVSGGTATINPNVAICQGKTAQLQVTGGTAYSWTPATGLSNPNIANPIASPTATTTYQVQVQTSPTCFIRLSTTVNVLPTAQAQFDTFQTDSCATFPLVNIRNTSTAGATYLWNFGNGQTSNAQNPPPIRYTAAGTYTITLTTNAATDCPSVLTRTVTVQENRNGITAAASPRQQICAGDSVQLTASGGTSYVWTPATGLSRPNIANPKASPSQTTTYTVRISNNFGCSKDTSVTVAVSPRLTPRFTTQLSDNCAVLPLVNFTNQSTTGADVSYLWNFGNGQTSTLQNPPPLRYAAAGNYLVVLTIRNENCVKADSQRLAIVANDDNNFVQRIRLSPDRRICVGETTPLSATGGTTYTWTPATGLSNANIAEPIASPTETTRYTVRIANRSGCFKDTTVLVDVAPRIVLDFDITLEELCEPYPLVRIISKVSGGDTYTWSFENGTTFVGTQPPPFKYTADGTYKITVTGKNRNCEKTNTQETIQKRIIANDFYRQIRVQPRNPKICATDNTQLNAVGGFRYLWTPATGLNNANIANPIASPSQTTTYNVRIFNERGCFVDSTVVVEVTPNIVADFELRVSSECGKNGVVSFINKSTGNGQYAWTLGDGKTSTAAEPKHEYEKSGEYEVLLEVFNGICRRTKTQKIKVENVNPPNVITPNGDNKNERFDLGLVREGWKLEIYDRWGKAVFKSDNYQNDWGQEAQNALYYYLLTSPENKTCKGWVMVMRGTE